MTGVLVNTHTLLWAVTDDDRLSSEARSALKEADSALLSVASCWELAIKASLGRAKLALGSPVEVFLGAQLERGAYQLLPISLPHIATVGTLPFHHRDPFDRMIVAQAMVEGVPIISRDDALDAYDVRRIW